MPGKVFLIPYYKAFQTDPRKSWRRKKPIMNFDLSISWEMTAHTKMVKFCWSNLMRNLNSMPWVLTTCIAHFRGSSGHWKGELSSTISPRCDKFFMHILYVGFECSTALTVYVWLVVCTWDTLCERPRDGKTKIHIFPGGCGCRVGFFHGGYKYGWRFKSAIFSVNIEYLNLYKGEYTIYKIRHTKHRILSALQ